MSLKNNISKELSDITVPISLEETKANQDNIIIVTDETNELQYNTIYRIEPSKTSFRLDMFKSNRKLRTNTLLRKSILKDGIINPILINDKFEIIDGQHRYDIALKNNIPIDFIIRDIGDDVAGTIISINNSQLSWNITDIVYHYSAEGNKEYQRLYHYMENYNDLISRSVITKIASGTWNLGSNKHESYKSGDFKNYKKSAEKFYSVLKDVATEFNFKPKRHFTIALYALWAYENFDLDRFKTKIKAIKNAPQEIEIWNNIGDAYVLFTQFVLRYNMGLSDKSKIKLNTISERHPSGDTIIYKPNELFLDEEKVKINT